MVQKPQKSRARTLLKKTLQFHELDDGCSNDTRTTKQKLNSK